MLTRENLRKLVKDIVPNPYKRGEVINWKKEHQKSYADTYAYDRLVEMYRNLTAVMMLDRYASAQGLKCE